MLKELTNVPLVIAAHGTRDPEGVAVCRALAERVRAKLPDTKLTMGFVRGPGGPRTEGRNGCRRRAADARDRRARADRHPGGH